MSKSGNSMSIDMKENEQKLAKLKKKGRKQ